MLIARYEPELLKMLHRVADIGVADVRSYEFRKWFGQDRISVSSWVDVHNRWTSLVKEDGYEHEIPLFFAEANGAFAFVWGENLQLTTPITPKFDAYFFVTVASKCGTKLNTTINTGYIDKNVDEGD